MSRQSKMPEQTIGFRVEGLTGLSKSASRFVRRHPKQARMVVAVALEAAAVQYAAADGGAAVDVPEALEPFVVHRPPESDMIGVSEAAARLRISRTTVYDWVGKKMLLGWKSTKRGLTIPTEQILGPGKVVPGLAEVLKTIDDPELAWEFLANEWPFADDMARPVDKLKAGNVAEVIGATPGFGMTFT